MPFVKPKPPPPTHFGLHLGPAVGRADDFWALAYCPDLDEIEQQDNIDHDQFTFILHYQGTQRTVHARVPYRLDALWQRCDGVLFAAGHQRVLLAFEANRMLELQLTDVPGCFSAVWGVDDLHLFCAGGGGNTGFVVAGQRGQWRRLRLPKGAADICDMGGFSKDDVYFVGDEGQVHHFDGRSVTRLRVPVPRANMLTGIARLDETRMVVSGYHGTLLVGNRRGWRRLATRSTETLLAIAALGGQAYYGDRSKLWSTDGVAPPQVAVDFPAAWVSGLADGLVLSHEEAAAVYQRGVLTPLCIDVER